MSNKDQKALEEEKKKLPQEPAPGVAETEDQDGIDPAPIQTGEPSKVAPRKQDKTGAVQEAEDEDEDEDEGYDDEGEDDEDEGEDDEDEEMDESMIASVLSSILESSEYSADVSELGNLLESQDFEEEFKEKAVKIFEAAVIATAKDKIQSVLEAAETTIRQKLDERYAQIEEEAEKYLDTVVESWKEENKIAIESGLRLENAESFMLGLKNLLEQHYVDVPEQKQDIFTAMVEESEQLEAQLAEQLDENETLKQEIASLKKNIMVEEFSKDMTMVKAERLKTLAESIQFEDEDSFLVALETLEENFLSEPKKKEEAPAGKPAQAPSLNEDEGSDSDDVDAIANWINQNASK